ncbi:hypothetical protein T492DRAFT_832969 [Pavlovales sp. CCMP2436]|nr:hypothetical protein T492DRAFT_832969 [Pavlovales sp. CCMP2436]
MSRVRGEIRPDEPIGKRDGANSVQQDAPSKEPLLNFASFPRWLREGPWTLGAKIYIPALITAVVLAAPTALAMRPSYPGGADAATPHVVLAASVVLYTVLVLAYMVRSIGVWPMITFTMLSWTMLAVRFSCVLCAGWSPALWLVGEALRARILMLATGFYVSTLVPSSSTSTW